jgi:transposase
MKYTEKQRLDIGHQIYDGELTKFEASEKYGMGLHIARKYMRLYRDANQLLPRNASRIANTAAIRTCADTKRLALNDLQDMTKEELIQALVKARIQEAHLKKVTR